jgi:hypothetical protein
MWSSGANQVGLELPVQVVRELPVDSSQADRKTAFPLPKRHRIDHDVWVDIGMFG